MPQRPLERVQDTHGTIFRRSLLVDSPLHPSSDAPTTGIDIPASCSWVSSSSAVSDASPAVLYAVDSLSQNSLGERRDNPSTVLKSSNVLSPVTKTAASPARADATIGSSSESGNDG